MIKFKFSLTNPSHDFLLKSYILLILIPKVVIFVSIFSVYLLGNLKGMWDMEGIIGFYIIGGVAGIFGYFLGLVLCLILIFVFNNKFMSGNRVPKFNRFPKLTLFAFSFLAYLATMWLLGYFI